jgi:hypothetical protein
VSTCLTVPGAIDLGDGRERTHARAERHGPGLRLDPLRCRVGVFRLRPGDRGFPYASRTRATFNCFQTRWVSSLQLLRLLREQARQEPTRESDVKIWVVSTADGEVYFSTKPKALAAAVECAVDQVTCSDTGNYTEADIEAVERLHTKGGKKLLAALKSCGALRQDVVRDRWF